MCGFPISTGRFFNTDKSSRILPSTLVLTGYFYYAYIFRKFLIASFKDLQQYT